jgi:hypothetical protein
MYTSTDAADCIQQKTSLIKALANYTGRSIVNVPLAKISTNTELQSVFFDNRYAVDGEDVPIKVSRLAIRARGGCFWTRAPQT